MRSGKFFVLLGLALTVALSLGFMGCGDDDAPTNSIGSLSDPEFVAVQEQLEQYVDSTIQFVQDGFGSITSISSGDVIDPIYYGPGYPNADSVNASYINGWNIIDVSMTGQNYNFGIIDSVKFFVNNQVSQNGVGADSLYFRHKWQVAAQNTVGSYINLDGQAGFDFRNLNGDAAVIDGYNEQVVHYQLVTNDSTVVRHFEFAADVDNFTITKGLSEWSSGCPTSGTISATLEMTYQKDQNDAVVTSWDITLSFTDGVAAVTAQSGTTQWTYTKEVCTPVVVTQ